MDYPGILKVVKKNNPDMSHREAMKEASKMFKRFKEAIGDAPPAPREPISPELTGEATGLIPIALLEALERRIRKVGPDINSICKNGREAMPGGSLVKHGKSGVNTMVTWEDNAGNRVPLIGYFYIWI